MALVWKEITDPQLAWELRQAGLLHWIDGNGVGKLFWSDEDGFGWKHYDWIARYRSACSPAGIYIDE